MNWTLLRKWHSLTSKYSSFIDVCIPRSSITRLSQQDKIHSTREATVKETIKEEKVGTDLGMTRAGSNLFHLQSSSGNLEHESDKESSTDNSESGRGEYCFSLCFPCLWNTKCKIHNHPVFSQITHSFCVIPKHIFLQTTYLCLIPLLLHSTQPGYTSRPYQVSFSSKCYFDQNEENHPTIYIRFYF